MQDILRSIWSALGVPQLWGLILTLIVATAVAIIKLFIDRAMRNQATQFTDTMQRETARQIEILKSELQTSFQLAEDIIAYSKTLDENEVLTIKRITDHLFEKYQKKILPTYIFFLLDVIQNYFGLELNTGDRVTEFLGFF